MIVSPHDPALLAEIDGLCETIAASIAQNVLGTTTLKMMEPDEIGLLLADKMDAFRDWLVEGGASDNDATIATNRVYGLTVASCAAMARRMQWEGGCA